MSGHTRGRNLSSCSEGIIYSITSLEAMREYGIMRLASRISDLRRRGYRIKVESIEGVNRYNEKTRYARYTKENEQWQV